MNVNFSRMKVVIQNPENFLYLQEADRWSADVGNALDFGNSDNAIQFCMAHRIGPVHVVLQWSGTPNSIAIPIVAGPERSSGEKAARTRKQT